MFNINVRSLVSSIYSRCWSRPPCPNLIGSINLNQLVIQRQGEREKLNTKLSQPMQEADARRKRVAKAQAATQRSNSHRLGTHNIQPPPLQLNISGYNMHGAIEIHWLVYTFPWRQPESTRGACPFDVACGPL